jgi:protoporphyrinogen oxidase
MTKSVTLIGAGPAGLAAALTLVKNKIPVHVLEKETTLGGLSRTLQYNGNLLDIGGHRFYTTFPEIMQLWHELLPVDFAQIERTSNIFYKNRLFAYPLSAMNILHQLGPIETARFLLSYIGTKAYPICKTDSFEGWMTRQFGHRLYSAFFQNYTEKIWGMPCKEISSDWARQRIQGMSIGQVIKSLLWPVRHDARRPKSVIQKFFYPRRGPGMMWEACAKRIALNGSAIETGIDIDCLRHDDGHVYEISGHDATGRDWSSPVDQLISSMPLRQLLEAMQPAPPEQILTAASRLTYRDYLLVFLVVAKKHIFADQWRYIQDESFKVARIQNFKNWSSALVQNQDFSTLGMEYYLNESDDAWSWTDERWLELATQECEKLDLFEPALLQDGSVIRIRQAYPIYDLGYKQTVQVLRAYLETFDNLQTIGRNGLHRYNNMDHSMLTGIAAADRLLGSNKNSWDIAA